MAQVPEAAASLPPPLGRALHDWRVVSQYKPRIYVHDNFLTHAECDHLVKLAENNLTLGTLLV